MDQWIERPFDWVTVGLAVLLLFTTSYPEFVLGQQVEETEEELYAIHERDGRRRTWKPSLLNMKQRLQEQEEQHRSLKQTVVALAKQ